MCGIAGYTGTKKLDEATLASCLKLMRRRGPDNQAYRSWTNPEGRNVFLLFSRLSIIDLDERSNQPLHSGSKWIVLNGELYNYLEIRKELSARGRKFSTQSDTEVLAQAIDEFGPAALDRCEGMWAFALYDEKDGTLLISRDRFGEKPLYLYRDATGIYFASEIKFIFALLGRSLPVNYNMLYRFLVNGYKSLYKVKERFFVGIEELPAASTLRIDRTGREKTELFWKPRFSENSGMTYAEAVSGVRDRLIRSMELRLRADVPLAFCMSGGVDSNALISIAKKTFQYDVHGFTIVNSDSRYEETEMVDHAVKELGIRHTAIPVTTDSFLEKLRILVRQHDAPVYTITYYAQWLLMEAVAKHGYRISLSGTAADELFSGYYDHHLAYLYEIRNDARLHPLSKKNWEEHIHPIVRNPHLGNPDLFVQNPNFREHIYLNAQDFEEYLKKPWHEPFTEENYTDHLLRNRMLNEMFHEAVPVILHEDDLNAMYFSIENRSPYLDRDLFEFCFQIPTQHLIQDGRAKAVLRDAAAGLAPEKIMQNRRKVGFNAPILSFLDTKNADIRNYLLDTSPIFDHVKRDRIESLVRKSDLPNSESKFLFYFLTSKMFLEEFAP